MCQIYQDLSSQNVMYIQNWNLFYGEKQTVSIFCKRCKRPTLYAEKKLQPYVG